MLVPKKVFIEHLYFNLHRLNPSFVIRIKERLITFACMYI